MGARYTAGRLLVGLTVVSLLAGCAAVASSTPPPASPIPTSKPSTAVGEPTPTTPTPIPSPPSYGPVTVVTGTATCPGMSWNWTTDPAGTQHVRDDYHAGRCTVETDDPRVSGLRSSTWNIDLWGDANAGNWALVQWGTPRLENAGGAWEGRATGVGSSHAGDFILNWYRGTGGYAGLAYLELWTGDEPWTIRGQIFPGDPPNPAGVPPVAVAMPTSTAAAGPGTASPPTPAAIAYGPVSVVTGLSDCPSIDFGKRTTGPDGVQHARGGTVICAETADDSRVGGTYTATWNLDWWGTADRTSGALVQWGTVRLVNAGGAWVGRATGVYSTDRGDIIATWYEGTGGYAGLSYFELTAGRGPWTIQGQIFPGNPPPPQGG